MSCTELQIELRNANFVMLTGQCSWTAQCFSQRKVVLMYSYTRGLITTTLSCIAAAAMKGVGCNENIYQGVAAVHPNTPRQQVSSQDKASIRLLRRDVSTRDNTIFRSLPHLVCRPQRNVRCLRRTKYNKDI